MEKNTQDVEGMREQIDYVEIFNLSNRIAQLANEASVLSKRLTENNISEEEREKLEAKLLEAVNGGSDLSEQRARIFDRNS